MGRWGYLLNHLGALSGSIVPHLKNLIWFPGDFTTSDQGTLGLKGEAGWRRERVGGKS